jgi:hypothetical protein
MNKLYSQLTAIEIVYGLNKRGRRILSWLRALESAAGKRLTYKTLIH